MEKSYRFVVGNKHKLLEHRCLYNEVENSSYLWRSEKMKSYMNKQSVYKQIVLIIYMSSCANTTIIEKKEEVIDMCTV